jgi:hypothetical protein
MPVATAGPASERAFAGDDEPTLKTLHERLIRGEK